MSKKTTAALTIFLIISAALILCIFLVMGEILEPAISVALFVIAAVGSLFLRPIRDDLDYQIENFFADKGIYKICIFGRAGSGKTTFIKAAFTFDSPTVRRSTEVFDCYEYKVQLGLKESINVAIADYKGQKPSQIIYHSPVDFFGSKGNRSINAILFFVDLVPRKADDNGNSLNDKEMLAWLKEGSTKEKLEARVKEHYDYINESILEVLFTSLYSERLKSIRLIINKLDLIESLVDDGYLSLGSFRNAEDYALHKFDRMIKEITRACSDLKLDDFYTEKISAKKRSNLKPLIVSLLSRSA